MGRNDTKSSKISEINSSNRGVTKQKARILLWGKRTVIGFYHKKRTTHTNKNLLETTQWQYAKFMNTNQNAVTSDMTK